MNVEQEGDGARRLRRLPSAIRAGTAELPFHLGWHRDAELPVPSQLPESLDATRDGRAYHQLAEYLRGF